MLRLLFIVVFLIVLIIFALSNLEDSTSKMIMFDIHLSVGILVMIVGIAGALFGAAITSIGGFRQRRRARKAEQHIQTLQGQLVALHERASASQSMPDVPAHDAPTPSTYRP